MIVCMPEMNSHLKGLAGRWSRQYLSGLCWDGVVGRFRSIHPTHSHIKDSVVTLKHEARTPVLPLSRLLVHPQHALTNKIVNGRLRTSTSPFQVDHEHGDTDVAEHLDSFEDGALVRVELLWHRSNVRLAADFNNRVGRA